jgi:phage terminase small subunit
MANRMRGAEGHVCKRKRLEGIDPVMARGKLDGVGRASQSRVKAGTSARTAKLRRKLFAEEFVGNGGNATRAAIAVGYAPHSAGVTGSRLLRDTDVQAAVYETEERALRKARLSTERVLQELERAIFADPRKLYDEKGRLKPIHSLDENTAAAIASLDVDDMVTRKGLLGRAIGRTTKVRFIDKLVAIDRAMKHLGLFERDNRQMESNLTIQVGLVAALPRKLIDSDEV